MITNILYKFNPKSSPHQDVPEHEFEVGQKLEAVKAGSPGVICAATVTKLVDHLVWVHLDSGRLVLDTLVDGVTSLRSVVLVESRGIKKV